MTDYIKRADGTPVIWKDAPLQRCPLDPRCECSSLHNDPNAPDFRRPLEYGRHPICTDCPNSFPAPVMQWNISVADWLCRNCGRRVGDATRVQSPTGILRKRGDLLL